MPAVAIIGGQWGDEGKGKIVDLLAEKARMVVRFAGGDNAGHTVVNPLGEFRMHLIPSGIFHPEVSCLIGNGVAVNAEVLLKEVASLRERGVPCHNLFISDRAHLIMPYHVLLDGLEEQARGGGAIGTTRKGIGPVYADKAARLGLRTGDLTDGEAFHQRLACVLELKNRVLTRVYGVEPLPLEEVYDRFRGYGEKLAPFIRETDLLVHDALQRGELVLLEGAQGTMLDVDFGTYPYVTSSSPLAGGACQGLGIGPRSIDAVLGVLKAYTTRVGGGPMPTELKEETGQEIRERGHEYGTTTGRPRRCGWFDGVVARFSARVNGFTSVVLTRFDILDGFPKVKVCTGYRLGDVRYEWPPSSIALLEKCQPIYEELPGWQVPTQDIRRFEDLPPAAKGYVRRVEELVGCPVSVISVGPRREQSIHMRPIL